VALTGDVIKAAIQNADNSDDFCERLAKAIVENLEVSLPAGVVIVKVTGQAAGTPNAASLPCEVK
jgi:hypothetical protein